MMKKKARVRIYEDPEALSRGAAGELVRRARETLADAGRFTVSLAGGSTPQRLYQRLGEDDRVDWARVHFFWGDERPVPPDHPESNFGNARRLLLARIGVPEDNVHRIRGELEDPADAAAAYESELREFFGLGASEFPRFDFVLLGMGSDGHVASLFPGNEALREAQRLAIAPWVEKLRAHRITLTCPVFNKAACIMFMVQGAEKAAAVERVLEGEEEPSYRPAQLIQPEGDLLWYLDRTAAEALHDHHCE